MKYFCEESINYKFIWEVAGKKGRIKHHCVRSNGKWYHNEDLRWVTAPLQQWYALREITKDEIFVEML